MSPLTLRRYRAERLLREEFELLRGRVLAGVRQRLLASGASLDESDLEACYAQAWQGLYAAVLDGQEIANPRAWLALVTFRRAIEECRARRHLQIGVDAAPHGVRGRGAGQAPSADADGDLAQRLDDRARLRQLLQGLRGRLDAREREAAALCYLQGLSRAEAAARMGLSAARMRKLMDGRAPGRPGVAGKVGELVETIRGGGWCEEQGSMMRALAFGVLDPRGERYQLAQAHRRECPACRAYVVSLRGLAVALPPPLLPIVGGLAHGGAGAGAAALASAKGAGGAVGPGATGALGAQGTAGVGGALSAAGAGGAGAAGGAGGGWLIVGGPLGAKLAAWCLLALGIGVGCIALGTGGSTAQRRDREPRPITARTAPFGAAAITARAARQPATPVTARGPLRTHAIPASPARRAAGSSGEFTPERGSGAASAPARTPASAPVLAAAASQRPAATAAQATGEREFSPVAAGP